MKRKKRRKHPGKIEREPALHLGAGFSLSRNNLADLGLEEARSFGEKLQAAEHFPHTFARVEDAFRRAGEISDRYSR